MAEDNILVDSLLALESSVEFVYIIAFLILVAVVSAFSRRRRGGVADDTAQHSYQSRKQLFSPAERSFYGVLSQAVGSECCVMGKVRVADVVSPRKGLSKSDWQKAFNKISAKHFDYVVCDAATLHVQYVVELNDRSHDKPRRSERDRFLREVCRSAGVPLFTFRVQRSYSLLDVTQALSEAA